MVGTQGIIRKGQADDSDAIADLINRAFEVERPYVDERPMTKNSVIDAMTSGIYFVAVDSQCVVIYVRLAYLY